MSKQTVTVMIIDGDETVVSTLPEFVPEGAYNVTFLSWWDCPYRQIVSMPTEQQPDLIVLCARIEEPQAFLLLSMLKLDPQTRDIPVLTYTTEYEGQDDDPAATPYDEPSAQPVLRMN
jgi:CheY-like chemotaxis protein